MNTEIFDARLQHYLRKVISNLPYEQKAQLKSLRLCNSRIMPQPNVEPAVFLLRNDGFDGKGEAKFFGQMTCKNPWACPHCTAKMMTKYKTKIALAIDALRDEKRKDRYFGFMVTFTIPHLRFMSCKEVTDILYNTYREFFRNSWKRRKQISDPTKLRTYGAMNNFIVGCDITYFVRCAEYTYGKNGWHPHFHVIFWVPRKNKDKIAQYQDATNEAWLKLAERKTLEYWNEHRLHGETEEQREVKVKCLYMYKKETKKNPAVKISVDKDGKVCESLSSDYLAGWGSDSELTGNVRKQATNKGHLTPYQILEKAANGDKKMEQLYIEFMLQVTKKPVHHRVDFKNGMLKNIVLPYKQTEGYKEVVKKNKRKSVWELVCWFSRQQWYDLCDKDKNAPVLSNILYLAVINRRDLLRNYLKSLDIDIIKRPHLFGQHVENIFNNCTKDAVA